MNPEIENLRIRLFADGADIASMLEMANKPYISGLTTNPTLMRKAGVANYPKFAKEVLFEIRDIPISFEVLSDEPREIIRQAKEIASWGENVFVKIPTSTSKGDPTIGIAELLSSLGIKLNITAAMTFDQVKSFSEVLNPKISNYISVFAGRIADTGRDPIPLMIQCVNLLSHKSKTELIWASPREVLNIFQADSIGCHVITATNEILHKLNLLGKDLTAYSIETVKMFYDDATAAGYEL